MKKILIIILSLFLFSPSFAATEYKQTVCPTGCNYTSLETCLNAQETNLTAIDQFLNVTISGTWANPGDTNALNVHNYITSATCIVKITATGDARNNGVFSFNKYFINVTGQTNPLNVESKYVYIDGIQVRHTSTGNYGTVGCLRWGDDAQYGEYKNSVLVNNENHGNSAGGNVRANNVTWYNNVFWSIGTNAQGAWSVGANCGSETNFYSNTGYGVYRMTDTGLTPGKIRNNVANNVANIAYNDKRGTYSNNIAPVGDTSGTIQANLTFTDTSNGDFHLVAGDTAAIDAGYDLSAIFTTDIVGTARGAAAWDIGAFEYSAGAPPATVDDGQVMIISKYDKPLHFNLN